jgi:hypothetical protein
MRSARPLKPERAWGTRVGSGLHRGPGHSPLSKDDFVVRASEASSVRAMTRALWLVCVSIASSPLLVGCALMGDGSGGVESGLKDGISRAYGSVDSVSCASTEFEVNGTNLYDCSVRFADGQTQTFCGFRTNGVPGWNRGPCSESRLAQN